MSRGRSSPDSPDHNPDRSLVDSLGLDFFLVSSRLCHRTGFGLKIFLDVDRHDLFHRDTDQEGNQAVVDLSCPDAKEALRVEALGVLSTRNTLDDIRKMDNAR